MRPASANSEKPDAFFTVHLSIQAAEIPLFSDPAACVSADILRNKGPAAIHLLRGLVFLIQHRAAAVGANTCEALKEKPSPITVMQAAGPEI